MEARHGRRAALGLYFAAEGLGGGVQRCERYGGCVTRWRVSIRFQVVPLFLMGDTENFDFVFDTEVFAHTRTNAPVKKRRRRALLGDMDTPSGYDGDARRSYLQTCM